MMKRYIAFFLVTVCLFLIPISLLAIFFEPITGDLTRVGQWSERDFGQNSKQPVIEFLANGTLISNPEILVLGDSFSVVNFWQSILFSRLNKKSLTFYIANIGCINDWVEFASKQSSAKTIIIETVERAFIDTFQAECKSKPIVSEEIASGKTSGSRPTMGLPVLDIRYLMATTINTLKMILKPKTSIIGRTVGNLPLKMSCANFSNKRADRLLYFRDDERKLNWSQKDINTAIDNVVKIQKMFTEQGKQFMFIVIPDKLSVYEDCLLNANDAVEGKINITELLMASGVNIPNLLPTLKSKRYEIMDLYYPNNTHFSESGYILMAAELEKFISSRK